jgi:hypothetical protein
MTLRLRVLLVPLLLWTLVLAGCAATTPPGRTADWDPFLDSLQLATIHWFLTATPGSTGLTPDRWPSPSPISIGAAGFGLTTLPVAVEHSLLSRREAVERILGTFRFLLAIPQSDHPTASGGFHGFYYHFIDGNTGLRVWKCELSTVDTGLLMMGVLFCQSYFDRDDHNETELRRLADSLYRRVDWKWAMGGRDGITLGWSPEEGFHEMTWQGYNEALFMYILALGSPTHPIPPTAYAHWLSGYKWLPFQEKEFVSFAPLFGHQFSACWLDFRDIRDSYMRVKGIDYFENSRRATYAQQAYGSANSAGWRDYADSIWGWTACDGPGDTTFVIDGIARVFQSYNARGPSADWTNDDGTIAPAAAGGSLPFAPEICAPALKAMRVRYGDQLYTEYGFRDAFNPSFVTPGTPAGWFDKDYLGIDQGPIVLMIENTRSGFVWRIMRRSPCIVQGFRRAGFTGGWLDAH